jgi:hypothetical protein
VDDEHLIVDAQAGRDGEELARPRVGLLPDVVGVYADRGRAEGARKEEGRREQERPHDGVAVGRAVGVGTAVGLENGVRQLAGRSIGTGVQVGPPGVTLAVGVHGVIEGVAVSVIDGLDVGLHVDVEVTAGLCE